MGGAVDVGIVPRIKPGSGVNDGLRLVRGGGVVQPDERPAVDRLVQSGKIPANPFHVKRRSGRGGLGRRSPRQVGGDIGLAQEIKLRRRGFGSRQPQAGMAGILFGLRLPALQQIAVAAGFAKGVDVLRIRRMTAGSSGFRRGQLGGRRLRTGMNRRQTGRRGGGRGFRAGRKSR